LINAFLFSPRNSEEGASQVD